MLAINICIGNACVYRCIRRAVYYNNIRIFPASIPCAMATELFEDIFEVRQLNPEGKKFDKGLISILAFVPRHFDLLRTYFTASHSSGWQRRFV